MPLSWVVMQVDPLLICKLTVMTSTMQSNCQHDCSQAASVGSHNLDLNLSPDVYIGAMVSCVHFGNWPSSGVFETFER